MNQKNSAPPKSGNNLADQLGSKTPVVDLPDQPVVNWEVQEGAMVGTKLVPQLVADYLKELNVVAEIDWFPETPHLMGINMLRNDADGLAALDHSDGTFRVGVVLDELVDRLAKKFEADVRIGEHHTNALSAQEQLPHPAKKSDIKVRVVEITEMPLSAVPFCAAANNLTLGTLNLPTGKRAVFYETTEDQIVDGSLISQLPAVGLYVSDQDQRILAVTNDEVTDPEGLVIHSWKMQTQVIAGGVPNPDPVLIGAIRDFLGHGNAPYRVAQMTGADQGELTGAFEANGQEGMVRAIGALGLPADAAAFLYSNIDLDGIENVEVFHQPGWAKAFGSSMNLKMKYPADTSTGPVTALARVAVKHPGLLRALNIVEGAVAASLIGVGAWARTHRKQTGNLVLLAGGAMMLDSGLRYSLGRLQRDRGPVPD